MSIKSDPKYASLKNLSLQIKGNVDEDDAILNQLVLQLVKSVLFICHFTRHLLALKIGAAGLIAFFMIFQSNDLKHEI